ncbi:hypothetical protein Bca4012_020299 [Brassica carinata]|uniref:Uncharacterized protein n=1 Tax=Brassica carinata TaxID=52824 RepID=A0A8X7WH42_BRACI|nr:hypothetical protein Bca52824_001316 [Brassica carinata]
MEIDKERRSLDLNRRPTIDDGVGDLPMNENEQEIEGIVGNEGHYQHNPSPMCVNSSSRRRTNSAIGGWTGDGQMTEDPYEFSQGWKGMDFRPVFWEQNTEHGCADRDPGNLASGPFDNIINLADTLNIVDDRCPTNENSIVDVDGSSTGSTDNSSNITGGRTMSDHINITTFTCGQYESGDGDHEGE